MIHAPTLLVWIPPHDCDSKSVSPSYVILASVELSFGAHPSRYSPSIFAKASTPALATIPSWGDVPPLTRSSRIIFPSGVARGNPLHQNGSGHRQYSVTSSRHASSRALVGPLEGEAVCAFLEQFGCSQAAFHPCAPGRSNCAIIQYRDDHGELILDGFGFRAAESAMATVSVSVFLSTSWAGLEPAISGDRKAEAREFLHAQISSFSRVIERGKLPRISNLGSKNGLSIH